jgi:hypothetical protein
VKTHCLIYTFFFVTSTSLKINRKIQSKFFLRTDQKLFRILNYLIIKLGYILLYEKWFRPLSGNSGPKPSS